MKRQNTPLNPLKINKLPIPPKTFLKLLGPSFILIGLGLGTGELILWPYLVSNWGLGIIWGAFLGISMQFFLNMEIERYTLANGESVFVGFNRLFKNIPHWFVLSTVIAFSWPGFSAAATAVLKPIFGFEDIKWVGIGMLVLVGLILTLGPILYKTVETFQKMLVLAGIPLILLIIVFIVKAEHINAMFRGLIGIGEGYRFWAEGLPLMSFLAAFAYSGAGGNLNLAQSFYIKAKGYGMGKYAGRITSLITGKKEKINIEGTTFNPTKEEIKKFRKWWKLVNLEHAIVFWGLGLFTILLLVLLSYATVYGNSNNAEGINFIFNQAGVVAVQTGGIFKVLLLIITSLMLFSTQLSVIDASGRIIAENIALIKRKTIQGSDVPKIYYMAIWGLLIFGILVYLSGFSEPRVLIILGAVLNAFCMFIYSGLLVKLNTKLLHKSIHPSTLRKGVVYLTFAFFGIFSVLVFVNQILK